MKKALFEICRGGAYVAPSADVLNLEAEQCFATSPYDTYGNEIEDAEEIIYGSF